MKLILLLATLLSAVFLADCLKERVWGCNGYRGPRVYHQIVKNKGHYWPFKASDEVIFPAKGVFSNHNITCIISTDQEVNGPGSTVVISKGGVGFPFVKLDYESTRGNGYNFLLDIY